MNPIITAAAIANADARLANAGLPTYTELKVERDDATVTSTERLVLVIQLKAQRDALRSLVLQARGAWVRDISNEPTHVDQADAVAWLDRARAALGEA